MGSFVLFSIGVVMKEVSQMHGGGNEKRGREETSEEEHHDRK